MKGISDVHSSRIETKGLVFARQGPIGLAGDYRRSFTSEHSARECRRSSPKTAQLAWKVLDSPLFDRAVAGAKSAAIAYATKKVAEAVAKVPELMVGKKKNPRKAVAMVAQGAITAANKGAVKLVPLKAVLNRHGRRGGSVRRNRGGGGFSTRARSAPIAKAVLKTNRGPKMNGRKSVVIAHEEYLGEVAGSVGFAVTSFPVNPGLVGSFPWLANIATQYEEYKVRKLLYKFETEAPSTTKGAVILVTDYDALDSAFTSKQQAMDYQGSTRTAPWTRVVHNASGPGSKPYGSRYVRSGALPDNADAKTYDVGTFQLITQGMADAATVGELYVQYEFEFIGPKVNNVLGQNLLCADIRAGGTISPAAPMGSAPAAVAGTTITVAINTSGGGSTATLGSSGRFLVSFSIVGTGITVIGLNASGGGSVATSYTNVINAAGTAASAVVSMDLTANLGQGMLMTVTGTTVTSAVLVISQISSGLLLAKPKPRAGLPLYKEADPLEAKLAQVELMLSRLGLCMNCGKAGVHDPACPRQPPPLTSTPTIGL